MEGYSEDLGLLLRGRHGVDLQDTHRHGLDIFIRLVR